MMEAGLLSKSDRHSLARTANVLRVLGMDCIRQRDFTGSSNRYENHGMT